MHENIVEFWRPQEGLAVAEEKLWESCAGAVAERNAEKLARLVRELSRLEEWKRRRAERERSESGNRQERAREGGGRLNAEV